MHVDDIKAIEAAIYEFRSTENKIKSLEVFSDQLNENRSYPARIAFDRPNFGPLPVPGVMVDDFIIQTIGLAKTRILQLRRQQSEINYPCSANQPVESEGASD